jgi:hypothetical protein
MLSRNNEGSEIYSPSELIFSSEWPNKYYVYVRDVNVWKLKNDIRSYYLSLVESFFGGISAMISNIGETSKSSFKMSKFELVNKKINDSLDCDPSFFDKILRCSKFPADGRRFKNINNFFEYLPMGYNHSICLATGVKKIRKPTDKEVWSFFIPEMHSEKIKSVKSIKLELQTLLNNVSSPPEEFLKAVSDAIRGKGGVTSMIGRSTRYKSLFMILMSGVLGNFYHEFFFNELKGKGRKSIRRMIDKLSHCRIIYVNMDLYPGDDGTIHLLTKETQRRNIGIFVGSIFSSSFDIKFDRHIIAFGSHARMDADLLTRLSSIEGLTATKESIFRSFQIDNPKLKRKNSFFLQNAFCLPS